MSRSVGHEVIVAAPPEEVFDLLARPARHAELDGSGTVRGLLSGPERLGLGDRFRMHMRIGLPYVITNRVVEFEEHRRIAWRHLGRHVWRWELEPVDGGTRVTETFDWSTALVPAAIEIAGYPRRNGRAIRATLDRLADRLGRVPA